jgi:hypothetical protein
MMCTLYGREGMSGGQSWLGYSAYVKREVFEILFIILAGKGKWQVVSGKW